MYRFERSTVGPFSLFTSRPSLGDAHRKRFLPGVTPVNQGTLNMYVAGRFVLEIPSIDWRREMAAGECSLDIELPAFPADLCVERCAEAGSVRICASPTALGARWARHIVDLPAGGLTVAPAGHVMVVLSGNIDCGGEPLQPGDARMLGDGIVLRSVAPARAALMAVI